MNKSEIRDIIQRMRSSLDEMSRTVDVIEESFESNNYTGDFEDWEPITKQMENWEQELYSHIGEKLT